MRAAARTSSACRCGAGGAACARAGAAASQPLAEPGDVLRAPGRPLDPPTRGLMESRFGRGFGDVRLHTGPRAAASARALGARAYTVGRHVVLGTSAGRAGGARRRALLAHELAHVVQQRRAGRADPAALRVSEDAGAEREADRAAARVTRGARAGEVTVLRAPAIQRQPEGGEGASEGAAETLGEAAREEGRGPAGPEGGSAPCVEPLEADAFDGVPRLDTITLIVLGTRFCGPCDTLERVLGSLCERFRDTRHPFRVRFYHVDVNPMDDAGDRVDTPEARRARELGARFGAPPVPHLLIYREYELVKHLRGYAGSPAPYEKLLAEVIEDAATSGAMRGLRWGGILGGIAGAIAGIVTAAATAATGALGAGWALLAGLGVGGAVAGLGLGLGALFGWIFGKDRGTSALPDERVAEIRAYVARLERGARGAAARPTRRERTAAETELVSASGDDDLARDTVQYWVENRASLRLSVDVRRLLVREMLTGVTLDADERAILKIVENSTNAEVLELLDPTRGVSLQDLRAALDGEEWEIFEQILERRFPELERTGAARTGILGCDAPQAIAIHHARPRALAMAAHAARCIGAQLAAPSARRDAEVQGLLDCYFRGASDADLRQVKRRFDELASVIPRHRYQCVPETIGGFRVRGPGGRLRDVPCFDGIAGGYLDMPRDIYLCGPFFDESPREQAMTLVHEGMHFTTPNLPRDPRRQPGCGVALETALRNPDSYTFLAASLERRACGEAGPASAPARGEDGEKP